MAHHCRAVATQSFPLGLQSVPGQSWPSPRTLEPPASQALDSRLQQARHPATPPEMLRFPSFGSSSLLKFDVLVVSPQKLRPSITTSPFCPSFCTL